MAKERVSSLMGRFIRFAQIATGEDYASLVRSLGKVCCKNKLRTPDCDVW